MSKIFFFLISFTTIENKEDFYSITIPKDWITKRENKKDSFLKHTIFNNKSLSIIQIYAIKTERRIDQKKFVDFITTELIAQKAGKPINEEKVRLSGISGLKLRYKTSNNEDHYRIDLYILSKSNYGYVIRAIFPQKNANQVESIIQTFKVNIPRSKISWLFLIGLILVSIYSGALAFKRFIDWLAPFHVINLLWSLSVLIIASITLYIIFLEINKIGIWISIITSAILLTLSVKIPSSVSVKKAFRAALEKNKAGTYRAFCENHKNAIRYVKKAKQKIKELVGTVVEDYRKFTFNKKVPLLNAVLAMFDFVAKHKNFKVSVVYDSENNIDKSITKFYKDNYNFTVRSPVEAFTTRKNKSREKYITALIKFAFHTFTPDDILWFETSKSKNKKNQIVMHICYQIVSTSSLYCWESENDLPDEKKTFFAGIEIYWKMEIIIPYHSEVYSFSLHSKPAQKIKIKGHKTENVYDAMALSAYAEFCKEFIKQSGLENTVKDLIKFKEENGKKSLSMHLTKEWLAEALSEFAEMEEGNLDLREITREYVELLTDVSTEFSPVDFSSFSYDNGGFDLDISFD